jgi:TetR/AcrR family transcriptional regulator, fatty acid biosynthesis regulator
MGLLASASIGRRMAPQRSLSRDESKAITRRRLLDAAAALLAKTGYGKLSASAVAREAEVAQPTFYVHFRDKDDLLRTLGEEQIGALRARLRAVRARIIEAHDLEAVRESFRVPLQVWLEHPALLRLYTQELLQPKSPLGAQARQLRSDLCRDLAEDLERFGLPAATKREREQLAMIAEAIVAQTEALALGLVEKRFASLESAVDVLTHFATSALGLGGTR